MKYTIKQIEVFDAVASLESVSSAAKFLSMTQSAVSMSLQQLERQLDRPLFERRGNRLILSHWGAWLRPKAKLLLQNAKGIEIGLREQHLISGNITVAASQTAAEHLLPQLISKIDGDFPDLRIGLQVENSIHVIEGVLNHEFELGVIEGGYSNDSRLSVAHWLEDHLVIIASPHHPYSQYKKVSAPQLEQAQWVLREIGAGTRRIFDGAAQGVLNQVEVWKEYESVEVIKALVANGPYLGCIPYLDAAQSVALKELVILPTPELDMRRSISFIWRKDAIDNPLRNCILREARRQQHRKY